MRHRNRKSPAPMGRCGTPERYEIELTDTSENKETHSPQQGQKLIPHPIPASDDQFTPAPPLAQVTRSPSYRQLIDELLSYSPWISAADVKFLESIRWNSRLNLQQISELTEIVDAFAIGEPRPAPFPTATKS
jgi:hypothetical protein